MATRLYLPSSSAAPVISPTADAAWEDTSILARLLAVTTKSSTAMTTVAFTDANSVDRDVLFRQYIYGPIAAQTLSAQTLKFQIRAIETTTSNNMFTAIGVRIIDGILTVRGTALAVTRDGVEVDAATLTNRQFSATTTQVISRDGDYVVIEIGTAGDPTGSSPHSSSLRIGDTAASDLAEDDTTTTDNNPWVEFANTITLYTGKPGILMAVPGMILQGPLGVIGY